MLKPVNCCFDLFVVFSHACGSSVYDCCCWKHIGQCCSFLGAIYKAVFTKGWPEMTGKQGKAWQSSATLVGFVNDIFKLSYQK